MKFGKQNRSLIAVDNLNIDDKINESLQKSVKLVNFKNAFKERIIEGKKVKGNLNAPKIYFSKYSDSHVD